MPIFAAETLTQICLKIFRAVGVPDEESEVVTRSMIDANLTGHHSHGVIHLPKYIQEIEASLIQPGAAIEFRRESPSMAVLNGNWGFGPVIATHAVKLAVQKAKNKDISSVVACRCNEVGRLGGYALKAAEQHMICVLTVNDHGGGPCVAPFGGIEGRLSTNPIACAIPVEGREPIILDMSTSVVASGKIGLRKNRQETVPEGWLINAEGNPTINTDDFYAAPPGALLPFGGIAAHKGFGLSFVIDILSGALTGAGCSRDSEARVGNGLFVMAINIASFVDVYDFNEEVKRFIAYVKSAKKSPGVEEILIPGERGFREENRQRQEGIFIDDSTWEAIQAVATKYRAGLAPK
jgi:uncharacterized oxidoreductase